MTLTSSTFLSIDTMAEDFILVRISGLWMSLGRGLVRGREFVMVNWNINVELIR